MDLGGVDFTSYSAPILEARAVPSSWKERVLWAVPGLSRRGPALVLTATSQGLVAHARAEHQEGGDRALFFPWASITQVQHSAWYMDADQALQDAFGRCDRLQLRLMPLFGAALYADIERSLTEAANPARLEEFRHFYSSYLPASLAKKPASAWPEFLFYLPARTDFGPPQALAHEIERLRQFYTAPSPR